MPSFHREDECRGGGHERDGRGGSGCTRHNQQERCRAERRDEPAFINLGRLLNPRFDETGLRIYIYIYTCVAPPTWHVHAWMSVGDDATAVVLVSR